MIFGHYGDRIGRKATLIATLLCMGIATFLMALVPTYDSIGIWGAIILTLLRALQGIGVGGEWGGSVLTGDGIILHTTVSEVSSRHGPSSAFPPACCCRR